MLQGFLRVLCQDVCGVELCKLWPRNRILRRAGEFVRVYLISLQQDLLHHPQLSGVTRPTIFVYHTVGARIHPQVTRHTCTPINMHASICLLFSYLLLSSRLCSYYDISLSIADRLLSCFFVCVFILSFLPLPFFSIFFFPVSDNFVSCYHHMYVFWPR